MGPKAEPPPNSSEPDFVFARRMYQAFADWAKDNAVRAWGEKNFAVVMLQKGFSKEKHRTGMRCNAPIAAHQIALLDRRQCDVIFARVLGATPRSPLASNHPSA